MDHSTLPADQYDKNRNIYQAGYGEIFFKNFLAGLGRAIGGIFMYLLFLAFLSYTFLTYAYPKIEPFINEYRTAVQGLNQLTGKTTGGKSNLPLPNQAAPYQQFIQDLQQSLPR